MSRSCCTEHSSSVQLALPIRHALQQRSEVDEEFDKRLVPAKTGLHRTEPTSVAPRGFENSPVEVSFCSSP